MNKIQFDVSKKMREFNTHSDLSKELKKIINFSISELIEYEETIEFNSFGKVADAIYYSFCGDEKELEKKTKEEILKYFKSNSEYIQIVENSNGEKTAETKYSISAFSYVMNKDHMFAVENSVYKVFECGYARCDKNNFTNLQNMTENEFLKISEDDKIYHTFKYLEKGIKQTGNFGDLVNKEAISSDGKEKVKIIIQFDRTFQPTYGRLEIRTRGLRKTAGIFFNALRHITDSLTITIYFPIQFLEDYEYSEASQNTVFQLYKEISTRSSAAGMGSYIRKLNGWFQIPAVRFTFPT